MNGQTLANLCRTDAVLEEQFRGVSSVDNLPLHVARYPGAYIVNTAPSFERGEHWLAIYFSSSRHSVLGEKRLYRLRFIRSFFVIA
jgi:hypothetical protein